MVKKRISDSMVSMRIGLKLFLGSFANMFVCLFLVVVYLFIGLAYQGKDIVFKFIIEYTSLRDFGP
jgi:hypothetical protein